MSEIERIMNGLGASSGTNVVPFGKHKGQPMEVLRQDPEYAQWILDNGVVSETKYRNVYVFLTGQQSVESQDTPEHNRYQVMFLDQTFANDVFDAAAPGLRINSVVENRVWSKLGNYNFSRQAEWDAEREEQMKHPPALEELGNVRVEFEVRGKMGGSADVQLSTGTSTARIEIKPSMGDDFPAVLRQMKASLCNVLYLGSYHGKGATLEDVKKLFGISHIKVLMHEEFWE